MPVLAHHACQAHDRSCVSPSWRSSKTADLGREIFGERLLVFGGGGLGISTAPVDDSCVPHVHHDAEVHSCAIDQTCNTARFLLFDAETRALSLKLVSGVFSIRGLLV
jgi:hypothetical protein